MKKLLIITPHLSTGGLPQFLLDKIGILINEFEVFLVEYDNITGGVLVVQRNKIQSLLKQVRRSPENFWSLDDNKWKLLDILAEVQPNIIHFEEFSETFVDHQILNRIYLNKSWFITESTHGTSFDINQKYFVPDKLMFVSKGNFDQYGEINHSSEVIEFPVNFKKRTEGLLSLGLNPLQKHVLNVGLFTQGKNQKEAFELSNSFIDKNVMFHFVGNQATNFQDYWEPLMKEKPSNCIVWGERNDVESFYKCMDLFLFTSKWENRPLSVLEALSNNLPVLMYNLPNYSNTFSKYDSVDFLTRDKETNINKIKRILNVK
jgi:glycosyltransferase involved in cell wall biosynthesis